MNVAFYIYIGREDNMVVLIKQLHGGADGVVRGRQRVAILVEDGNGDGGTWIISMSGVCGGWGEDHWIVIAGVGVQQCSSK